MASYTLKSIYGLTGTIRCYLAGLSKCITKTLALVVKASAFRLRNSGFDSLVADSCLKESVILCDIASWSKARFMF